NYSGLIEKLKISCSFDDFMDDFNAFLKESNHNHDKLFKSFSGDKKLEVSDMYEMQKKSNYFYLLPKDVNSSKKIEMSTNPFGDVASEVKMMVDLYNAEVVGKYNNDKKHKNDKCVKLNDSISTREVFCDEINRIYACVSHPRFSTLKPILDKFAKHKDVKHHIGRRDNSKFFYQFVKKETAPVEEQKNPAKTKENIDFLTAVSGVSASIPSLDTNKLTQIPGNPFGDEPPAVAQLTELDLLKATYSAMVEAPYQSNNSHGKGTKKLKLTNENISSVAEFCRKMNKIKNDTNETLLSTRYKLLFDFSKDEEVKKLIGIMEGTPKDFYVKPTVKLCNNGLLLEKMLNEYVNIEASTLRAGHVKKIKNDLKNITIRDNISIELETNGHVMIRNFPDDNRKIALVLTALLEQHQSKGTLSQKIAEFLKISRLGAYMQLQSLPDKLKIQVSVNQDTVESVNDKISHLSDLMDFIGRHLKHINTVLVNFPTRPGEGASLAQLQEYHYAQMLAFDIHSSNYTEPRGNIISAKRWIQVKLGNVIGSVTKETYFGGKNDKPIDTIKNLREILNRNVNNQNYEKSVLNGFKYQIINEGLERIEKHAQKLEHLVTHHLVSEDMAKNLTFALCYSIASECVDLKQQSKSINFNKFRSKAKFVVPMVAALSVGVLIAGSLSTVLAPLAPILAIGICCFGLYYLITKCKPKLEKSEMSKQFTLAMENLVYQKDFFLDSHDVGWMEAWKYRKEAIKRADKAL
ncbi:MFS transporter permease, partial [Yersinia artesiana]